MDFLRLKSWASGDNLIPEGWGFQGQEGVDPSGSGIHTRILFPLFPRITHTLKLSRVTPAKLQSYSSTGPRDQLVALVTGSPL